MRKLWVQGLYGGWPHAGRASLLCLIVAMIAVAPSASAQNPRVKAKVVQRILNQKQLNQKQLNKELKQNPAGGPALERFLQMSPQQRRQALAALPPARQRGILRTVALLELLSVEERQQLRGRYQALAEMPVERQDAVRGELKALRQLSPQDRRQRLGSSELRQNFSPEELQLITEVAGPVGQ